MSAAVVLVVIAIVQAVFLSLLFVFLVVRRAYDFRQRAAFLAGRAGIDGPLRSWLVAGAHPDPVVAALAALPRGTAIGYVSLLARQTIPAANRDELAEALRHESWIADAISQRHSRFWWNRLEAARALSLVAGVNERGAVEDLLNDEHPAVQIAAAAALPRVADPPMMGRLLDRLHRTPKVVRHFLTTVLIHSRAAIAGELATRIRAGSSVAELAAWIELADAIDDSGAIAVAMDHVGHPASAVRRTLARAVRRRPGPRTQELLTILLEDADPPVRAAAARTIGELGGSDYVPLIAPLLGDPAWTVRLRAAIALAQGGKRGRMVLRDARSSPDRFSRDMAAMVSGLSDGAVLELGDG